jgi:RNA polymerase sigma-70 factor (ECF subfamily)
MDSDMDVLTDEQLVETYRAGDEASLQVLFERYVGPVYNFVCRYVGNEGDAQDIVQDAFVSVWKNIKRFDPNRKFKTWIFAIAKNASLNWIKKKKPILFSAFENAQGENVLADTLSDPAPLPDELLADVDLARKLSLAVAQLNPNWRAVLSLRYDNQLTFQEISEALSEPLDTVKSRHRRALLHLKELLSG